MGLTPQQKSIQREGLQKLTGLRILTTVNYWGGLIGMAVMAIVMLFWTFIYLGNPAVLGDAPGWVFWVVTLIPLVIFLAGMWTWYLAKSLREFKMWAYDWYTYQTAMGAVSQGIGSLTKFARKDWEGGLSGLVSGAIKGGIVAYLLKKDVRQTYTDYSNKLWGFSKMGVNPEMVSVQADFRFSAKSFRDYWTVMNSDWIVLGIGIGFSITVLAMSLLINDAEASTQTFVGHGMMTVFFTAVMVLVLHIYLGRSSPKSFPAFMGTLILGVVGVLIVVFVTEMWWPLSIPTFLLFFIGWLVVQQVASHAYFCKRT